MIESNMPRSDIESYGSRGATHNNPAKIIDDFYLYVDDKEKSIGYWLANTGYWESWITAWFTKNIKEGDKCLDIGANYGYYTRIMEKLSGSNGFIYAIEANPDLCDMISKSINDFPIEDAAKVKILSIAASNKNGQEILDISTEYIGGSSIVYGKAILPSNIDENQWDKRITVNSFRLDDIIDEQIDFIKLDIEGAEPLAWEGMTRLISNARSIIIECGPYLPIEFIDKLYDQYDIYKINFDGNEEFIDRKTFNELDDLIMAVLRKKNA